MRAIAVAQTVPVAGEVSQNVTEHLRLANAAADGGAHVLVFPELSLTGYEMDLAVNLAFSESDARLRPLSDLASSRRLAMIVGVPLKRSGQLHIAATIISPSGVMQVYTKRHLGTFGPGASVDGEVPPGEPTVFRKGELDPLVDFDDQKGAVAICADANRGAHAAHAAARGASTYLVSAFVIPSEFEEATSNLEEHARRHRMAVAFSNYGGRSGGMAAAGRSGVWSQNGELLGQLDSCGAGVIVATEESGSWRVKTWQALA